MLQEKYTDRIDAIFAKYPDKRSAVMPLLYLAQEEYGYVTPASCAEIGTILDMDATQVRSIAGFYTMFREEPKGKFWLQVCTDLPCALRGADQFYEALLKELDVEDGGTTEDGMFTVEQVMCLAACDRAPMMQCNFHFYENLDMDIVRDLIAQWRSGVERPEIRLKREPRPAAEDAREQEPETEAARGVGPFSKPADGPGDSVTDDLHRKTSAPPELTDEGDTPPADATVPGEEK